MLWLGDVLVLVGYGRVCIRPIRHCNGENDDDVALSVM